jgi:hypothetical protein
MSQPGQDARYEVARKGVPLGVHALGELGGLLAAGQLLWSDDCWTEGMESWVKLSDLQEQIEAATTHASGGPSGKRQLLIVLAGIASLTIGLAGYLLVVGEPSEAGGPPTAPAPTPPAAVSTAREKALRRQIAELQQDISGLTARSFATKREESSDVVEYVHRHYLNVGNRIPLRAHVDSTGLRYLYTFYAGKTWLFHTQLRFDMDKQTVTTQPIPAYKASWKISDDAMVSESCRFPSKDDQKVMARIALGSQSKIGMQMVGRRQSGMWPLSHETKEAIKDCQELAELLAKRNALMRELGAAP